jgi:hypothetical protein
MSQYTSSHSKQNESINRHPHRPHHGRSFYAKSKGHPPDCDKVERQFNEMKLRGEVGPPGALYESGRDLCKAIDKDTDHQPLQHASAVCGELWTQPKVKALPRKGDDEQRHGEYCQEDVFDALVKEPPCATGVLRETGSESREQHSDYRSRDHQEIGYD